MTASARSAPAQQQPRWETWEGEWGRGSEGTGSGGGVAEEALRGQGVEGAVEGGCTQSRLPGILADQPTRGI